MLRGALLLAASLLAFTATAHAELGRDDQWFYIPATAERGAMAEFRGDGNAGPSTDLIFQIECARRPARLLFRYYGELDLERWVRPADIDAPMELIVNDSAVYPMETGRSGTQFLGSLTLTAGIAAAIRDADYIAIYVPDPMGEAFHAGEAPALKRLTRECSAHSVG